MKKPTLVLASRACAIAPKSLSSILVRLTGQFLSFDPMPKATGRSAYSIRIGRAMQRKSNLPWISARKDWCLNIDSDERLDEALRNSLSQLIAAPQSVVGWRIARRPYLVGFGYTPQNVTERKNLRLIRSGKGAYDLSHAVHEGIVPAGT